MSDSYSSEEKERFRSYLRVHLKDDKLSLPVEEQITLLQKKVRKQNWFLGINAAAILFFGYSFFYGITQLSDTLLYVLFGVFVINVILIFYQKKQLRELIAFLKDTAGQS